MGLATIPEAIADIKAGKFVIIVDDADRENEGDLVIAAEKVDADAINFYGAARVRFDMRAPYRGTPG